MNCFKVCNLSGLGTSERGSDTPRMQDSYGKWLPWWRDAENSCPALNFVNLTCCFAFAFEKIRRVKVKNEIKYTVDFMEHWTNPKAWLEQFGNSTCVEQDSLSFSFGFWDLFLNSFVEPMRALRIPRLANMQVELKKSFRRILSTVLHVTWHSCRCVIISD